MKIKYSSSLEWIKIKVVFAHDHIFKKDSKGNLFTTGSFNNEVWKRYLKHFSEIIITARQESIGDKDIYKKYNNFDLEETNFVPLPNLSSPTAKINNRKVARNKIKNALKETDALIARVPSEIGLLAIEVAKEMNKPYAVEVVACVWDALWNYGNIQGKLYAPVAMYNLKKQIKAAPYVLYVTNEFLQNRYPTTGKAVNISNVEIQKVEEESLTKRLKKLNESKQLYTIGMIGSLRNKIKGLETAFKALELLKRENINFEFQILGDGDERPWLELAEMLGIENKIKFWGVLPGGEPVLNWMDNIDLYIQPSYQEGLPRAVIEAMSRACPVIGSTAGGIPELIDKNCLHKPGDYVSLFQIIKRTIFDIKQAKTLAEQNLEEAKYYKKDILDKKRENFWREFINFNLE